VGTVQARVSGLPIACRGRQICNYYPAKLPCDTLKNVTRRIVFDALSHFWREHEQKQFRTSPNERGGPCCSVRNSIDL